MAKNVKAAPITMCPVDWLRVSPEYRDVLPGHSGGQEGVLEELYESIKKEGIRDPLVVLAQPPGGPNGAIVLDGHTRLRIAKDLGIKEVPCILYMGGDESPEAVRAWIIRNQLARRNLTDAQRAELIGKLYNAQKGKKGDFKRFDAKCHDDTLDKTGKATAEKIAEEQGVSEATVKRAGKFETAMSRIRSVSNEAAVRALTDSNIKISAISALADASDADIKAAAESIIAPGRLPAAEPKAARPPKPVPSYFARINDVNERLLSLKREYDADPSVINADNYLSVRAIIGYLETNIADLKKAVCGDAEAEKAAKPEAVKKAPAKAEVKPAAEKPAKPEAVKEAKPEPTPTKAKANIVKASSAEAKEAKPVSSVKGNDVKEGFAKMKSEAEADAGALTEEEMDEAIDEAIESEEDEMTEDEQADMKTECIGIAEKEIGLIKNTKKPKVVSEKEMRGYAHQLGRSVKWTKELLKDYAVVE